MQAQVIEALGELGSATAGELAEKTGRPLALVREALGTLAPPPTAKDLAVAGRPLVTAPSARLVVAGDRFELAPPLPPEPEPVPPCTMRASGVHPAIARSHTGKLICVACQRPVPKGTPDGRL